MKHADDDELICHDYGPDPNQPVLDEDLHSPKAAIEQLQRLYAHAMTESGLPYRSPTHRIAEQLAATAKAAAYAEALALLTGSSDWRGRSRERARNLRDRCHMDQTTISQAEHAESKLRRYGLP